MEIGGWVTDPGWFAGLEFIPVLEHDESSVHEAKGRVPLLATSPQVPPGNLDETPVTVVDLGSDSSDSSSRTWRSLSPLCDDSDEEDLEEDVCCGLPLETLRERDVEGLFALLAKWKGKERRHDTATLNRLLHQRPVVTVQDGDTVVVLRQYKVLAHRGVKASLPCSALLFRNAVYRSTCRGRQPKQASDAVKERARKLKLARVRVCCGVALSFTLGRLGESDAVRVGKGLQRAGGPACGHEETGVV
jgi:hypothetical protein